MDPITTFKMHLVVMQVLAFIFGMLFERSLENRRKQDEE